MKNIKSIVFGSSVVAVLALASSCGQEDIATPDAAARVKIFHVVVNAPANALTPGATGVDVFIDGQLLDLNKTINFPVPGSNATFTKPFRDTLTYGRQFPADSTYMGFTPGERNLKITPFGVPGTVVLDAKLNLESGKSYTVFATDSLPTISGVVITDNVPAPVNKKSPFRFVHMSPDAPPCDILRARGTDTVTLFTNIAYRQATAFIQVDTSVGTTGPFKTDYIVRASGTGKSVRPFTSAVLVNGRAYSLVIRGYLSQTGTKGINATLMTNAR